MNFKKNVKSKNLYREYVKIINGILQLAPREAEIFSLFIKIHKEWKPIFDIDYRNILSTDSRKLVMKESLVNKNNLSKYIQSLKDKGLIVKNEDNDGYEIVAQMVPDVVDNSLKLTFILNTNGE